MVSNYVIGRNRRTQRIVSKYAKRKTSGKNYEQRTKRKGAYGFRRYGSMGIFDVCKFDWVEGNLVCFLLQNKFSTIQNPRQNLWDKRRILSWININQAYKEKYPWLWVGFALKQYRKPEQLVRLN